MDHLTDIRTALRAGKRIRTQVVLAQLTELNPADRSFQDLTASLAEYKDIEPVKSQGVKVISADHIT